jgi:hypothetical protein
VVKVLIGFTRGFLIGWGWSLLSFSQSLMKR